MDKDERIAQLEAALKFYADEWQGNCHGDPETPGLLQTWQEPTGALWDDAGRKARQALFSPEPPK